jgi:hypothetical protein
MALLFLLTTDVMASNKRPVLTRANSLGTKSAAKSTEKPKDKPKEQSKQTRAKTDEIEWTIKDSQLSCANAETAYRQRMEWLITLLAPYLQGRTFNEALLKKGKRITF